MKKVVYTMEQMQHLASILNSITITGIQNCKLLTLGIQIIDNPLEEIEEDENPLEEIEGGENTKGGE